ncbi:hypothetical protein TWF788_010589 [Orbilia oligospora]|uniref:F-box domain-containing protein n=1 Tax=Orbilia oligospora TaxID=2813651 RepID=A0A7C8Q2H4_ORBOL|nr:hypothetical protein TWF788_010589 [Orbilia oligospora]
MSDVELEPLASRIPVETWHSIYTYLDREGLSNISSCSRFFRQTAVQLLFRRVRLTEEAIEGFGSNGSLGYLARSVHDIFFSSPITYDPDYLRIFDIPSYICFNLSIFPNIRGVHISYLSDESYYWIFPIAILRTISRYPWFKTLQRLSIKGVGVHPYTRMFSETQPDPFTLPINPDVIYFATGGQQIELIKFDKTVPFPPSLKELSIYYVLRPHFSRYDVRGQVQIPGDRDKLPCLNPPILYPDWTNNNTLTNLTFRTKDLDLWPGVQPIYPSIKYLHIITERCSWKDLGRIVIRMPNVEGFRLETVVFVVLPHGYRFLSGFSKLKRARVPWRTAFRGELSEEKRRRYLGPAVEVAALRREVGGLVSGVVEDEGSENVPIGGLRELEYVEFVRGYQKIPLKHHFDFGEIPYESFGEGVCRVWRDGERWDAKLKGVWRRFPGVYEEEWEGYGG